jgi:cold shock CspA family protein
MAKAMLFIDGTWLYSNVPRLSDAFGRPEFRVDFGKLPSVLAEQVASRINGTHVDIVRTYLFGSYAANYDARDDEAVQRRRDFFSMLSEEYFYEVETYPINFKGRRLKRVDRDPEDLFEPREKCVDIALASSMLYFAAVPAAYDIAVAVVGDQDFRPAFQHVRRLGKRVAIASIKGSCSPELSDPRDTSRVTDFDVVWLDDLLHRLELKFERHQLQCEAPAHKGPRGVWTTFHPRKGQRFYCDVCRREFSRQRLDVQRDYPGVPLNGEQGHEAYLEDEPQPGATMAGFIKRRVADRGFGFIEAADGRDYFFHLSDLHSSLPFDSAVEGLSVEFEVKKPPSLDRAGAATGVRPRELEPEDIEEGDYEDDDEAEEEGQGEYLGTE